MEDGQGDNQDNLCKIWVGTALNCECSAISINCAKMHLVFNFATIKTIYVSHIRAASN